MAHGRARAKAQRARNEMADQFEDVVAEFHTEMRDVRNELARLRTLDHASEDERDPDLRLN